MLGSRLRPPIPGGHPLPQPADLPLHPPLPSGCPGPREPRPSPPPGLAALSSSSPPSELTTAPVTASLSPPPSSSSASLTDLVSSQFWKLLIALISLPSGRHTEIAYLISPLSSVGWRGPAGGRGGGTELLLEGNCGGVGGPGKLGASTAVGEHQRQASGARDGGPQACFTQPRPASSPSPDSPAPARLCAPFRRWLRSLSPRQSPSAL